MQAQNHRGRAALVVASFLLATACSSTAKTATKAEFIDWLTTTEMVGPYDEEMATCIADRMYAAGLTEEQAGEFLAEGDEPSQLDMYTAAAVDCRLGGIEDAINGTG